MTTNLVHNAIVHNLPEQGTVWVTTIVHPKAAVLTVENTGEKLTPQLVATLAEPFQRGTRRIRADHAGVGLGLAIVKSISHAHDGTLTLTPRVDGGLRVTVQLPAAPPPTGPELKNSQRDTNPPRPAVTNGSSLEPGGRTASSDRSAKDSKPASGGGKAG
jgi:two-component system sensor histidine kinase VanS